MTFKTIISLMLSFSFLFLIQCKGQTKQNENKLVPEIKKEIVGGPFENAEYTFIGMPKHIQSVDTSKGWNQKGQKLLITGTIFKRDGVTPAPNIILYYYHTDVNGLYSNAPNLDRRVVRHGYIRGWVQSDATGKYSIYTVRPESYPNSQEPAHIHPAIKESAIDNAYYIDELVFDDDKFLTSSKRKAMQNRGGSGILRVLEDGDLQIAEHNIILGLNIPKYPEMKVDTINSGLEIGEGVFSFTPFHAYGPDKGTKTCPVCKYGRYHGILYFVGNQPDWNGIAKWLMYLESESSERKQYLKAYFVYGNDKNYDKSVREKELETLGTRLNLKYVALTFVPSFEDKTSDIDLNQINNEVVNTFLIYKQSTIVRKYLNLKPIPSNFEMITTALDETQGDYFNLSSPKHD